jgi:serine/threonine-protein kinase
VEDVGAVGEEPFIAMERVPGCTVARLLVLLAEMQSELPVEAAVALLSDALRGLEALHSAVHPTTHEPLAVVHRDVSPRNLMITPERRLVLIDLGLGKSNLRDWATRTGTLMGTPGYIAPEQIAQADVDHRADLYAIAVVGFELLTVHHYVKRGEPIEMLEACLAGPFRPPSTLRSSIPAALDRFFERALALDPNDRFASASEMLAALTAVVKAGPPDASMFPAAFHREIAETEQRVKAQVANHDEALPPEEPTEIYASRSEGLTRTKPLPLRRRSAPGRPILVTLVLTLVALAIGIGIGVGYRMSIEEESVSVAPAPVEPTIEPAPRVSVTPKPARVEARVPKSAPIDRPAAPRTKRTIAQEEPPSRVESVAPDFDVLVERASRLRAERPQLAADLDSLITDATMWRRAEPSERTRAAWARLQAKLREIEASP